MITFPSVSKKFASVIITSMNLIIVPTFTLANMDVARGNFYALALRIDSE